jgi:hypothetical protein
MWSGIFILFQVPIKDEVSENSADHEDLIQVEENTED